MNQFINQVRIVKKINDEASHELNSSKTVNTISRRHCIERLNTQKKSYLYTQSLMAEAYLKFSELMNSKTELHKNWDARSKIRFSNLIHDYPNIIEMDMIHPLEIHAS